MGLAADAVYDSPTRDIDVVGVTGTNGKTTTSFLVYAILAAAGRRARTAWHDRAPNRR